MVKMVHVPLAVGNIHLFVLKGFGLIVLFMLMYDSN